MTDFLPSGPRAVAVIIQGDQCLLMRRVREDRDYYIFGGGTIEVGETNEQAVVREVAEEFSLTVSAPEYLFSLINEGREEFWFLITHFSGTPTLGGPEKERMTELNQYIPTWVKLAEVFKLTNLYPQIGQQQLQGWFHSHSDIL